MCKDRRGRSLGNKSHTKSKCVDKGDIAPPCNPLLHVLKGSGNLAGVFALCHVFIIDVASEVRQEERHF